MLAVKLTDLGLNSSLCDWIDFLTGRPQVVKMGQFTSNSITLNVGAPRGCVLSPLLYSLVLASLLSSRILTILICTCLDNTGERETVYVKGCYCIVSVAISPPFSVIV